MRILLLLLFTATTLLSYAGKTNVPVADETSSSICATYMPAVLFISMVIAGAVYALNANKKRRDINEKNNPEKKG